MDVPPPVFKDPYQMYPGPPPPAHAQYMYPHPPPAGYAMGAPYIPAPYAVQYQVPGAMEGGMAMPPMPVPPPTEDHPDMYISEEVKMFLPYFHHKFKEKSIQEILNIYENEYVRLSDRYFKEFPWPDSDRIAQLIPDVDKMFLILYRELRFRHIYAKHKPTIDDRFESYFNYLDLFDHILNTEAPRDVDLPNQWLWDMVDEFIYQFQSFVQFRGKLNSRSSEEIQSLKSNTKVWNVHSILNVLYSLVEKSCINQQLEAFMAGEDPASVAGEFGSCSFYKNLGYYSLVGLLRLHCQMGDYHTALLSVKNVQLSKKVLATTRVPASQISLYYYVGFCYFMTRKYRDAVRVFSNIIVFIQRVKQHFQPKSYQHDLVIKQNDQMLQILAIILTLFPQHVDEAVNSQLRDRRFQDDIVKLQEGDQAVFKKMFMNCCPKFISPLPPDYDALPENYIKVPTEHQCSVFLRELQPQLMVPVVRSYLKFYTTMPVAKLAAFMDKDEATLRELLLRFKHKCRTIVPAGPHLPSEVQTVSDIDFYIDGDMIHIADTKVARRYGDYFLRQINKLQDVNQTLTR